VAKTLIRVVLSLLKNHVRTKRFWILSALAARAAYLATNEYGMNPFKKSLAGEHVFLTGAGRGCGRLIAIRLGTLGCKLSISNTNPEMLQETKR
jgi:hypothetical protein